MRVFGYYLFIGVFEAATIHYAVAKIFGPLLFGRGWCGYACWTAMVLDFFPYKKPQASKKKDRLYPVYHIFIFAFFRGATFSESRREYGENHVYSFYRGEYSVLYCRGLILAFLFKDNRAFCKYICPVNDLSETYELFLL